MTNDDLYTGSNSGSFGNYKAAEQREELVKEKREKKSQLIPAYELVQELIEKEVANVKDVSFLYVDTYVLPEELNAEIIARRRYLNYLNALSTKLASLLREQA
jgi:hypothetical protein